MWEKFPKATGTSILKSKAMKSNVTMLMNTTIFPTLVGSGGLATSTVITYFNKTMEVNTTSAVTAVSGCYKPSEYFDHMTRPVDDPDFPWPGIWFSLPVTNIWYWCTDQVCMYTLRTKSYIQILCPKIIIQILTVFLTSSLIT